MAASGIVDPTKAAKYPIILSDALLGKASKETYTGIRYNHRPALSSETAPNTARLKKSPKDGSYNLGFDDNGDKYHYKGTRTTNDGNYVLIFDPVRKAFVLHSVDSMFHMNVTKTPTDSNVESLRKQFPHLEVENGGSKTGDGKDAAEEKASPSKAISAAKGKAAKETKPPATAKGAASKGKKGKAAADKKQPTMELTLPTAPAESPLPPFPQLAVPEPAPVPAPEEKKSRRRALSPVESEDDNDDGLEIVFPDDPPAFNPGFQPRNNFSPAFPANINRRFSEFVRGEEDDEDADGELEDDIYKDQDAPEWDAFKPPSPVHAPIVEPERFVFESAAQDSDADAEGEADDGFDLDDELEAEFQMAFHQVNNEAQVTQANNEDSEESEEE